MRNCAAGGSLHSSRPLPCRDSLVPRGPYARAEPARAGRRHAGGLAGIAAPPANARRAVRSCRMQAARPRPCAARWGPYHLLPPCAAGLAQRLEPAQRAGTRAACRRRRAAKAGRAIAIAMRAKCSAAGRPRRAAAPLRPAGGACERVGAGARPPAAFLLRRRRAGVHGQAAGAWRQCLRISGRITRAGASCPVSREADTIRGGTSSAISRPAASAWHGRWCGAWSTRGAGSARRGESGRCRTAPSRQARPPDRPGGLYAENPRQYRRARIAGGVAVELRHGVRVGVRVGVRGAMEGSRWHAAQGRLRFERHKGSARMPGMNGAEPAASSSAGDGTAAPRLRPPPSGALRHARPRPPATVRKPPPTAIPRPRPPRSAHARGQRPQCGRSPRRSTRPLPSTRRPRSPPPRRPCCARRLPSSCLPFARSHIDAARTARSYSPAASAAASLARPALWPACADTP